MSDYRRFYVPGGQFFFTIVTARRRPILANPQAQAALRQAIETCRESKPFQIPALVLLPDHLHMIWTMPPYDHNFSTRIGRIKADFSRLWLASGGHETSVREYDRKNGRRGVWQRRFWEHLIRDPTDFENHYHYIHFNPVKHGYVQCVRDWPWSSFHQAVAKGYYPPDWGCTNQGTPAGYIDLQQD
jgi:putative transposase